MTKQKKPPATQEDDIQFGVNWTKSGWAGLPEIARRAKCARYNIGDTSQYRHRKAIIQELWPENVYSWNEWSDRRLKSTCRYNFVTWLGPGASGKTSDAAIAALEYWLEAPNETAVVVCSTTKDMLRTRIWGQIVHFYSLLPAEVKKKYELLDASCFIRCDVGDWKNGIKGVAVQDGPVEEAVNNIIGMHTKRVLWILDEMQGVREAIVKAIPNLLTNPESRFWGMGNPDLLTSLLCRYSEPIGGWDSIVKFQDEWEIHSHGYPGKAACLFFDGRKSPAILDPEWGKKNPWMINQKWIDDLLWSKEVNGNENDPAFMTQRIGWPPSMGVESTVLDNSILTTFKCQQEKPVWTDGYTACAGLDPAFNGGDRGVLQFARRGFVRDEDGARWVICLQDAMVVPINSESQRPIHYQILDFVKGECQKRNIPPTEVAIAAAGEGGGLASIFQQEWGAINPIEEGGKPSERADDQGKLAKDRYDTRASELALGIRDFAMNHGLRGLGPNAADECCKRQTFYRNGKWCVEPKRGSKGRTDASGAARKGFKERLGFSPDFADSVGILIEHCRMKGANTTEGTQSATKNNDNWEREVKQADAIYAESYADHSPYEYEMV